MFRADSRGATASFLAYLIRIVFIMIGLIFIAFGAWQFYSSYAFQQTAVATTAEVVSVEAFTKEERNSDGYYKTTITYAPTLRYRDLSGASHVSTPVLRSTSYNYPVGAEVDVLYDATSPRDVRIKGFMSAWGFGAVFFGSLIYFLERGTWQYVDSGSSVSADVHGGETSDILYIARSGSAASSESGVDDHYVLCEVPKILCEYMEDLLLIIVSFI